MAEYIFEEVLFPSIESANEVIRAMRDMIEIYGCVTVDDYYDLAGIQTTSDYIHRDIDVQYGWHTVNASIYPCKCGFAISFNPRPRWIGEALDK